MSGEPLLIAQISDLHIKRPGELAYGVVDTAAALRNCVAHLNGLDPRPAIVVCSGDLVDGGAREEYDHLKQLLSPLMLPLVVIPGNHDDREEFRRAFPHQKYAAATGSANQLVSVADVDLVLLDSMVPGELYGRLDANTLDWLSSVLAATPQRPAFVFLHHPPFRTGVVHMDELNLHNADDFIAIIGRHRRVQRVACGHVHRAVVTRVADVPATICPAVNHAVELAFGHDAPPTFKLEPPAFHMHAWFAGGEFGSLVTHHVPIGAFAGPHAFFASDGKFL
jgi:3',5'-cyclic-AMP phosphodiesterase